MRCFGNPGTAQDRSPARLGRRKCFGLPFPGDDARSSNAANTAATNRSATVTLSVRGTQPSRAGRPALPGGGPRGGSGPRPARLAPPAHLLTELLREFGRELNARAGVFRPPGEHPFQVLVGCPRFG